MILLASHDDPETAEAFALADLAAEIEIQSTPEPDQ